MVTSENNNKTFKSLFEWRKAVFERDNYTCVWCGYNWVDFDGSLTSGLQADHIETIALFPQKKLLLSNGQTLCIDCYKIKSAQDQKTFYDEHYGNKNRLDKNLVKTIYKKFREETKNAANKN